MKEFVYLSYFNILKQRVDQDNGLIQVLLGPRQVGKTTCTVKLMEEFYKGINM